MSESASDPRAFSGEAGLQELERRVRDDLSRLNYPVANWVPPRAGPDGRSLLDALVIGAGMCGQTAAFALLREGVRNVRIVDRAAAGSEGPWGTYARMQTLRSPKHLTGPDLGIGSLTYRAWHEARFGAEGWASLHKVGRLDWLDYLVWVRRMIGLALESRTELIALQAAGDAIRAELCGPHGTEMVHARKLVLAMGRDGSGAPRWPAFASFDPVGSGASPLACGSDPLASAADPRLAGGPRQVFHAAEDIDFGALHGRRVAVLGAGASAFDNAGTALEAGAADVVLFVRRPHLPQVNKSKWTSFPGFLHGFARLDDAQRWAFYTYILDEQVPPPYESVLRCDRHANFSIRFGAPWNDLIPDGNGVRIVTPAGDERFDAAIVATGFDVDLIDRPELAAMRDHVLLWSNRITPQQAAAHPEAARFPYLGAGFELQERRPGSMPTLRQLHLFNWGCTMSHGALAGDIPGLAIGAQRLARALVDDLFTADADLHYRNMRAHNEEELAPTRYFVPLEQRK